MKKLGLFLLVLCGVALADTPIQVINGNTGAYTSINVGGSGANIPSLNTVTSGNCAQYSSTTGALVDAGFPCGSGNGNGTVTSVGGTAPIVSTGGTTPNLSISPATTTTPGSLAAADKAFLNAYSNATVVLATSNSYSSIVCNASTDDTAAWNTLVSTVPDRSLIQIPGCTSYVTGAISIPAGKHLSFRGAGQTKTIIQSNGSTSDTFTLGDWYNTFEGITFQGLNTTVTNATALSSTATTLTVGSTANFPASGSFYAQTNLGWTLISYTSISSGTVFAGVTTTTASTTVAGGPLTVKTGGYGVNAGSNTHVYLRDVQFNYLYNGWLNNGTQCGIIDSSGFGIVNFDLQFNGGNVNAIIHNYTTDGIPAAVAHIEVNQAGSMLISDSDIIRGQTNLRLNPTSPNGVFGVYVVNTYLDTATAVSGVASSGNGLLIQGTGNVQRVKVSGSWLSSASHDGFWCNSTAATLPTDIELLNNNIYSNASSGVDMTGCQDVIVKGNQIAGNVTAGINLTASTGSVTKLMAEGNRIGPTGGIGANGTGIVAAAGTYGAIEVRGNDVVGNTTAARTFGAITVANFAQYAITDNPGINPFGAVTPPIATPVTATTYTNNTGYRCVVKYSGATITASALNGVAFGTAVANANNFVTLDPGGTISLTGTTLAWVWVGN